MSSSQVVHCPGCRNWLGIVVGDRVESKHRRRRWRIRDGAVECEHCHAAIEIVDGRPVAGMYEGGARTRVARAPVVLD